MSEPHDIRSKHKEPSYDQTGFFSHIDFGLIFPAFKDKGHLMS